ncbi:MAG: DUF1289 domain-containing protein [Celeribacter marinus]
MSSNESRKVWSRAEIESPCTSVCQIDPDTRLCLGCARSIDEIGVWGSLSAEARRTIMADLPTRQVSTGKRKGGRAARLKRKPI